MAAAAEDESQDRARRLGLQSGLTVQEMGYDDDVDEALRAGIEAVVGSELVDEDFDDVVDVVIMWWREDDGDLVDGLVDHVVERLDPFGRLVGIDVDVLGGEAAGEQRVSVTSWGHR